MSNKLHLADGRVVIALDLTGKRWLRIDHAAGGMPYECSRLHEAHSFASAKDAADYLKHFVKDYPEAEILWLKFVEVEYENQTEVLAKLTEYERELAELNKKYGRQT